MTTHPTDRLSALNRSLTSHAPPSQEVIDDIEDIRMYAKDLGQTIISRTSPSREASLATTHLEETVMWAVKAVILQGVQA